MDEQLAGQDWATKGGAPRQVQPRASRRRLADFAAVYGLAVVFVLVMAVFGLLRPTSFFSAILQGPARDLVVVGFIGLAKVGGIRVRNGALGTHPVNGGAGIQTAGEGKADFFARRQILKDVSHLKYSEFR